MSDPPKWRIKSFESLASTSDLCIALAMAGEHGHLAIRAARQTAARGSRGREWDTLTGNLAVSVLLRPATSARDAGLWALLAAVALAEAVDAVAVPVNLRLKWPNDLMLGGRKLGGILLDTALLPDGRLDWLVIGCGLNLARAPAGAAALGEFDPAALAQAFLDRLDVWDRERMINGFGHVRQAWLERGPSVGEWLRVSAAGRESAGAFAGLGTHGALLLQTGGQVHAFDTGELLQADR